MQTIIDIEEPVLIDTNKPDEPEKDPVKKTVSAAVKTDEVPTPKVVDKPVVEKILTDEELAKLKLGKKSDGKDTAGIFQEPKKVYVPPVIITKPPIVEPTDIPDEDPKFDNISGFIQKKFNYPEEAIQMQKEGKCYLKFVVNLDGSVSDVSIVRGVPDCPECDKEALRVVRLMKNWEPGKIAGKPVRSWMRLPINFKLE